MSFKFIEKKSAGRRNIGDNIVCAISKVKGGQASRSLRTSFVFYNDSLELIGCGIGSNVSIGVDGYRIAILK